MSIREYADELIQKDSLFRDISEQKETVWINNRYLPVEMVDGLCRLIVSDKDIAQAEERFQRFAPFLRKCFPETEPQNGLIESPLKEIRGMKQCLAEACGAEIPGRLFLKMDSELPIAGSVKARGGIYEVLKYAEDLVGKAGLVDKSDSYERFADDDVRRFLNQYTVQVGSTGNLGLSIGIMSAALGFRVKIHMSAEARQWKKDLLRAKGAEVIEYQDDYSKAVAEGRRLSALDPMSYFVDDEYSISLFLGYAAAAGRLKQQLDEKKITVDAGHPLFVYIPCGVGGAPGGICYGLKRLFGDCAHVFFCEPTLYPSVLLGMASDRYQEVNVADFGLGGTTAADGLACASPSGLVTRIDRNLVAGDMTVQDARLFEYLRMLEASEGVFIEPSSCAAFKGIVGLTKSAAGTAFLLKNGLNRENLENAVHICWATGGRFVPEEVRDEYRKTYL